MKCLSVFVFIIVAIASASAIGSEFFAGFKGMLTKLKTPTTTQPPTDYCKLVNMDIRGSIIPNYDLMVRHWQQQCDRQRANQGKQQ